MAALESAFCGKLEEELVKHVKAMEAAMFCLSLTDLRRLAFDIAIRADMTHPFDTAKGLAGVDWAKAFIDRHADVSLWRPIATSLARLTGFNKRVVADFYQKYRAVLTGGEFTAIRNVELCVLNGITAGMAVHFVHKKGRLSSKAVDSVAFIRWSYQVRHSELFNRLFVMRL